MPASFETLECNFRPKAEQLVADCEANGTPVSPFFTVRSPWKQARLWRQSRSSREIAAGVEQLKAAGAPWLAAVIGEVGPQWGAWATNAAPGNSWHQWGEAVDCVAMVDGSMSWDTIRGERGGPGDAYYRFYAERAVELGLTSLSRIGDWVHVQLRAESAPARVVSWPEIEAEMQRRFVT